MSDSVEDREGDRPTSTGTKAGSASGTASSQMASHKAVKHRATTGSFKLVASRELQRFSSADSSIKLAAEIEDPESAVDFLRRGTSNLTPLKLKLSSCSDEWMLAFLDHGGLELVFACLENLGKRGFSKFSVAMDQLLCVGCIKAVMNSKVGLDHIVDRTAYVRTLAEGMI